MMHGHRGGQKKAKEQIEKPSRSARRLQKAPSFTQRSAAAHKGLRSCAGKPWEWQFDGMRLADIDQATPAPRSTRQILHPEQYCGQDPVARTVVQMRDPSSALWGWSKVAQADR
jgi:hypothetical protein